MLETVLSEVHSISMVEWLAIGVTMVVSGLVMGFLGFGASIVIVIGASQIWDPVVAVPLATISGLPATLQLLPGAARHADKRFVLPYGITALLAAPFGTWLLVIVDPLIMKIVISLLVLAMVALLASGWKPQRPPGVPSVLATGLAASLIQGSAGVGGPPAVAVSLARGGPTHQIRANVIAALSVLCLTSIPPLIWFGLITLKILILCVLLIPLYSGAIWLGARYFSDRGHGHYRAAALIGLAAVGIITLALSLRAYVGS